MSLKDILTVFETLLNATLKAGLFDKHEAAKAVIETRDELQKHADAEVIQPQKKLTAE